MPTRLFASLLWAIATPALLAAAPQPAAVLADVRAAELELSGARKLSGVELGTGFAELRLGEGWLFPTRTPAGEVVELVFIGRGTLDFETEDAIEASQLELFTGEPALEETFTEAVLLITSDQAATALLGRPVEPAPAEVIERANARWQAWRGGPLRAQLDVEAASVLDRLGDPLYQGQFSGFFFGESHGQLVIGLQPEAPEQLTIGRFEPLELEGRQRRRAERRIGRLHRQGRLLGLRLDELGVFDTWVSMSLRNPGGEPAPGLASFEPVHYHLQALIDTGEESLEATATIDLVSQVRGARSVLFELPADLVVDAVRSGDGQDLVYHRLKNRCRVFLPSADADRLRIEVDYRGKGLASRGRAWLPVDNFRWYPRIGSVDRATYELELSWPKRYELHGSGTVVADERRGELRWQRRKLDRPALGASFSVGVFRTGKIRANDVEITLAADNSLGSRADRREIGEAVGSALGYFERIFGDYPDDQLTVVTVPTGLSQSLPGFIQLSNLAMEDDPFFGWLLGLEDRRTIIAHELAHQWWGNSVGWQTYRDQWISEAMANYSALLWARRGAPEDVRLGLGPTAGWRRSLRQTLADGRRLESVGPLVLGERLDSSVASAYEPIVYKKGAVVVDMLAGFWGEAAFIDMLGRLTRAAAGHVISTEDFFDLLEGLSGTQLDAFAERFVYGTGLPDVYYDYRFEPLGGGRHRVHLEAEQEVPYRFHYRIIETSHGLDVARERVDQAHEQTAPMVVPFQIEIEAPAAAGPRRHLLTGRLALDGPTTTLQMDIEMEAEHQPLALRLDALSQVFGTFHDRTTRPKSIDFWRAVAAAAGAGDDAVARAEARRLFEAVLATSTPLPPGADRAERKEIEEQDRFNDWRTHLQLARLDLRAGALGDAGASLARAEALRPRGSMSAKNSQRQLEARLALLRGETEQAYDQLRRIIRRQKQRADVETWLLVAIAAERTGRIGEAREALAKVEDTGADVHRLTSKLESSS